MSNLAGLHDIEASAIAPPQTWIVDTVALSERPTARRYPTSLHCIARLNYGYGSTGTLPPSDQYNAFAVQVAHYVAGSSNCHRWIIGNEPNLPREWPAGEPIYPWHYAAAFELCRQAIHALPTHDRDEVLVAGAGNWNAELKYDGNERGDWITYWRDTLDLLEGAYDGYAIHSYTHGYDPALVTSTARMQSPFQDRYYNFLSYRDYLDAVPPAYAHLPAYITEANGDGAWQATGLMPAMLGEVDHWNQSNNAPRIHCVTFYRYPRYDHFFIEGKDDVAQEYRAAVDLGYQSPPADLTPRPPEPPRPRPPIEPPRPRPPEPPIEPPDGQDGDTIIEWDNRLDTRGVVVTEAVTAGSSLGSAWRVIVGRWYDEQEAQGRHNCYIAVLDESGVLIEGVPLRWYWQDGEETKASEIKSDPFLGGMYSLDFGMYSVAPSYGFVVADGTPSDRVDGLGLGSIEQPQHTIHTAYYFEIRRFLDDGDPQPPEPPIGVEPPPIRPPSERIEPLLWPLTGPVTTWFGEPVERFGQHNGIDIACRLETPVAAVYDGEVMYSGVDKDYGLYIRIYHEALNFHSFYAHLAEWLVNPGERVRRGQTVALSGSTGNSTGPHLHLEFRGGTRDGYYDVSYGYTNGRFDPRAAYLITGAPLSPSAAR